ncbi:MAG: cytochrome c peroxidase [Planctomycetota bacterium]|nr:cytochrome c peroxidase [Planctomycetota bacterium]
MRRALASLLATAVLATAVALDTSHLEAARDLPAPARDGAYYDAGSPPPAKVELGRMLFFDQLLSGNRNIACATCHHPEHAGTDGLALGLGEGATGLGSERRTGADLAPGVHGRVPRNAPALFNLGAREFTRLFHDGRVEADPEGFFDGGFITPAKWKLPTGLDNVLAAQAMFPVTSPVEMAGQKGENELADAKALNKAAGPGGVWDLLAQRLRGVPEYVRLFQEAYPAAVRSAADITYVQAANAIAAFQTTAFRADDSPFDRHLRGTTPLTGAAKRGLDLFYGKAACSSCHAGTFQTDHEFHAIAMPQIGPGKADGRDASYYDATGEQAFLEDLGRGRVTVRARDHYRFLTPSLRNVALTGPWGHAGAYDSLEAVVRHHLDPVTQLDRYRLPQGLLPALPRVAELVADGDALRQTWLAPVRFAAFQQRDAWVQSRDSLRAAVAAANEQPVVALADEEVADLLAFLHALTDERSRNLGHLVPERVPSGLPVSD